MTSVSVLNLAALVSLVPACFWSTRFEAQGRLAVLWGLLGVGGLGTAIWAVVPLSHAWQTDLSAALRVSVALSMVVFLVSAGLSETVRRLAGLFAPLMLIMTVLAALTNAPGAEAVTVTDPDQVLWLHILISITTYALLSIAAVSALAAVLQERRLKRRGAPSGSLSALPSILDAEAVVQRFLLFAWAVLGLGILSGMALNLSNDVTPLVLDHKTIFALGAFFTIGLLLLARYLSGVRGQRAARWVLMAYLLVTLAYPGVKFVSGILGE